MVIFLFLMLFIVMNRSGSGVLERPHIGKKSPYLPIQRTDPAWRPTANETGLNCYKIKFFGAFVKGCVQETRTGDTEFTSLNYIPTFGKYYVGF
jgi:hypothetical protein